MSKRRALVLAGLFGALVAALLLVEGVPARRGPERAQRPPEKPARPPELAPRPGERPDVAPPTSAHPAAPTSATAAAPTSAGLAAAPAPLSDAELRAKIRAGEPGYEVLASRLPAETDRVAPRWSEGDEWIVETYYRQMQAPDQPWTGPAVFRFRVEREVSFRDRPCFEIVVSNASDAASEPSVFYVTRDGHLAGQTTTVTQQGKKRTITNVPEEDAGAIRASFSVVPFALPAFGTEARVAPAGLANEPPARARDRAARARMPQPSDLVGAGGDYLDLEFEDPTDKSLIKQRWSREDMRWPVVSRTATTASFRRKG